MLLLPLQATLQALLLLPLPATMAMAVQPSAFKCQDITLGNRHYNLSALDRDWTTGGSNPLVFNPCSPLMFHGGGCPPHPDTWMCGVEATTGKGKVAIGAPRQLFFKGDKPDELVILFTAEQSSWSDSGFPWLGLLRLRCNPTAGESGPMVPRVSNGVYFLEWETRHACSTQANPSPPVEPPKHQSSSFFGVLALLCSGGLFVYFVTSILYRAVWLGARGTDMIPHWELLCDLAGFLRELAGNIWQRLRGGPSAGGYQHI